MLATCEANDTSSGQLTKQPATRQSTPRDDGSKTGVADADADADADTDALLALARALGPAAEATTAPALDAATVASIRLNIEWRGERWTTVGMIGGGGVGSPSNSSISCCTLTGSKSAMSSSSPRSMVGRWIGLAGGCWDGVDAETVRVGLDWIGRYQDSRDSGFIE